MIPAHRASLLVPLVLLALAACQSEPLPKDEIPQDFLFSYSYEPLPGTEPDPDDDRPDYWRISVDVAGFVDYEVRYGAPHPVVKKDDFNIPPEKLQSIYQLVREVGLHEMRSSYIGDLPGAGKESFYVVGRNQPKEVTVEATTIPKLADLRNSLYDQLDILTILDRPMLVTKKIILDWSTGIFYPADCPAVGNILPEHRREFADPWAALDAGGIPSQEYDPFEAFK